MNINATIISMFLMYSLLHNMLTSTSTQKAKDGAYRTAVSDHLYMHSIVDRKCSISVFFLYFYQTRKKA